MLSIAYMGYAKENISNVPGKVASGDNKTVRTQLMKMGAGCAPATQQKDLDINNVRTTILNGGDMWWNLSNARYEIPKVEPGQVSKHSLFAGALWIGGITQGNLRIAAQTYRQSGNDFFPGPLQVDGTASISKDRCKEFDKIWKVSIEEIDAFRNTPSAWSSPTEVFTTWPAHGGLGEAKYLAPFVDVNNDGDYDPFSGDYPSFDQNNSKNIPDQMLYIIYNDKGNIHAESEGLPIGLELHTQAFGYATNDEINNMTFYRTTIYNRGSETIDSCIFGQWVDADLGNYSDDYVECDVKRNLGICYNGDDNDEGILGYGLNPPSIGMNFFEGPLRPDGSEIGLSKFVYYNNDWSVIGNPQRPEHYWNYLNGRWKDGLSITYGGNGRSGTDTASFMFPGKTDPVGRAEWTERTSGNKPADRRFLQTAGPFSLLPGAVNRVTVAAVWAKATTGGATGSFNLLKEASDKAYVLYKNNFTLIDGPDAPEVEVIELNREVVLSFTNAKKTEDYIDSTAGLCSNKTTFKFQGYQIYQLKSNSIPSDIRDVEQAKLVAQCDIQDGANLLVNVVMDADLNEGVKKIMVNGEDKGVKHTFQFNKDYFSTESDQTMINFQTYYYMVIAYANAINCVLDQTQYLAGRKNVKVYKVVPHNSAPHSQGTKLNATFGDGPQITTIEGKGNGGNTLMLTKESIAKALVAPYFDPKPVYKGGAGPVTIKVVNPFKVPMADFELTFTDTSIGKGDILKPDSSFWTLKNLTTNEVKVADRLLSTKYEQVFTQWGLSVSIDQPITPGDASNVNDDSNGWIDGTIEYADPTKQWLTGVPDEAVTQGTLTIPFNWIRSGSVGKPEFNNFMLHDFADPGTKEPLDPRKVYSKILNGTVAPYALCARASTATEFTYGPAWAVGGVGGASTDNPLSDLQSVDVVLTSDKSKWTRSVVLELGEDKNLTIGNIEKMNRRASQSVDKNGVADGTGTGFGWFPGYAINVETGERLNIMFGEDSSLPTENGNDMVWNPTVNYFDRNTLTPVWGGKHHIYIMGSKPFILAGTVRYRGPIYDECKSYDSLFTLIQNGVSSILNKRYIFSQPLWVTMPILNPSAYLLSPKDGIVPGEVTIRLRVKRPYAKYLAAGATAVNNSMPVYQFSTTGIAPEKENVAAGKSALDLISITPNPYYAYSGYEDPGNQLDNEVKITNLPKKCIVSIYTQSGYLVRRIRKDDDTKTWIDWDIKNDAGVPIASGIYIIHINADGLGERVIKWFGIMRPADFDTF